jgi:outer membrane protein OmpA-like peptidoglycan-associated protein
MNILSRTGAAKLRGLGRSIFFLGTLLWAAGTGRAGEEPQPIYQVTVTPASTKAINYRNLTGKTIIGFRGTVLLPEAEGRAKLRNKGGSMEITAKFEKMAPASRFGSEYLTYVLWAVTPVGRPVNLGEVIVKKNGKAKLEAHTNLQTFGLVVTAEPHFAVSQVSSAVVLENTVTKETRGQVEEVEARYELLPRGAYVLAGNPMDLPPAVQDPKVNAYVYQAANAIRIARADQADLYAPAEFQKALDLMAQVQAEKKQWKKPAVILARQAVQQAEDARLVAAKVQEQARLDQEKQSAEAARKEAEAARAETESTRARSEAARLQAQKEADQAREAASREVGAEKLALRRKLRDQLNRLLDTRETERGVVVSMTDLLFPSGKSALLPATREKLAKIAGILLAYPGVAVTVEGHTDSTGSEGFNLKLSQRRAEAVRAYLLRQGLAPEAVAARGFGSGRTIASDDTPSGRQQNRRVELVLTGGAIGF